MGEADIGHVDHGHVGGEAIVVAAGGCGHCGDTATSQGTAAAISGDTNDVNRGDWHPSMVVSIVATGLRSRRLHGACLTESMDGAVFNARRRKRADVAAFSASIVGALLSALPRSLRCC